MTFFTAIDRYVFRLVLVPMIGVFALAASLLMLEKMLRLMEFVSTEGGPVNIVFRMLVNLIPEYAGLASLDFARPVPAKHWLQASNPSERWKWDFMFQEVNEQKWDGLTAALPQLNIIPLTPVQEAPKGEQR